MKTKLIIQILIVLSVLSCSENNLLLNEVESKKDNTLLKFSSVNEFEATFLEIIELTDEELKAYEESKGYRSYGRAAEDFYKNIDFESFKSTEELKSFIDNNSNYLQLIEDENGELELEIQYYNLPERYVMNECQMFQIGENVYRYFKDGIVVTTHSNIEKLKESGTDIQKFSNNKEYTVVLNNDKHSKNFTGYCGTEVSQRSTNGKNRLKLELTLKRMFDLNHVDDPYDLRIHYIQRPYKKTLGVWFWCSRTMKADSKWTVRFYKDNNELRELPITYFRNWAKTSKWERLSDIGDFNQDKSFYLTSYDLWGDTYDVSAISLECH